MVKYRNPADLPKTEPNSRAVQKSETPLPLSCSRVSLVTLRGRGQTRPFEGVPKCGD